MLVTTGRLKRTVKSKNKFLDHHLQQVITIVWNVVANSGAFDSIAHQLKKFRHYWSSKYRHTEQRWSAEGTRRRTTSVKETYGFWGTVGKTIFWRKPNLFPGFSTEQWRCMSPAKLKGSWDRMVESLKMKMWNLQLLINPHSGVGWLISFLLLCFYKKRFHKWWYSSSPGIVSAPAWVCLFPV